MSLASQVLLLASRVSAEFKSVRTALTGKADLSGGVVTNTQMPNGLRSTENASTIVTDLNNATGNGFWRGESTAANTPSAGSYFHVQVINLGGDWIVQIAYQINPAGGYSGMWMRRFENSSAWTAWQKCWITQTELDARYMSSTAKLNTLSASGDVTFNGYRATTLADPTAATDAATKQYVDNHTWGASRLAADVKPTQAGGTAVVSDLALRAIGSTAGTAMPGNATLDTIPVAGAVAFGGFKATGLANPVAAQDAATKTYVDTLAISDTQLPARLRSNTQANFISDANNATSSGYYWVTNLSTAHSPDIATDWYIHVVAYSTTVVAQTAYDSTNRVFTRALSGGVWTAWTLLAQDAAIRSYVDSKVASSTGFGGATLNVSGGFANLTPGPTVGFPITLPAGVARFICSATMTANQTNVQLTITLYLDGVQQALMELLPSATTTGGVGRVTLPSSSFTATVTAGTHYVQFRATGGGTSNSSDKGTIYCTVLPA